MEKTRIVTPRNLVRAFAAMFLEEPHATTRSYGALVDKVGSEIFAEGHRLEPYYVAAFTLYKLEYHFRNGPLTSQYKSARFHILLAARLLANPAPLPKMNSHEMERYCRSIMNKLWDSTAAARLFERAAAAVETVASGNFHCDNIRTQPFTEQVTAYCRSGAMAPRLRARLMVPPAASAP
jgi:hypothetical protein